ncbi:MAG: biotin/lipoyl-binding protein, partial [Salinivirgaceae bacterium]|nr:biotin/lipoyl-binding protein [Salinivirgaceae bacterium]
MDRVIEQKKGLAVVFSKKALPYWLGAGVVALVVYLLLQSDSKTMRVDANTLTISNVADGKFDDYIRVSGQVQPQTTIQLSPLEGGVVERIVTEEGTRVKAGDPILILSNENLDMQILNSEAELAEKENMLRNTV